MPFPFEVDFEDVESDLETYVDAVFGALESDFLVMPKGEGFVEFPVFDDAYEVLKRATRGFAELTPATVVPVVLQKPMCLIVMRCILGLTQPEWAYYTSHHSGEGVSQGAARTLDRQIRKAPDTPVSKRATLTRRRIGLLIEAGCALLRDGAPSGMDDRLLHRLDKADTKEGRASIVAAGELGLPYSVLLYERLLGRQFATHRDSVSELIGKIVENAVEDVLSRHGISARKTGNTDRLPGFDQAPDFVVPNEQNPRVVIEAKLSQDDGTARDKVTRIQHLAELSGQGGGLRFEVVACIAGRGFGVRRGEMKKLLLATKGKVFTLQNMAQLVKHTSLVNYASR